MKLELFIALRYLREKRKQAMVSVISTVSVIGIAAGVMALVIALALSTGVKEDIRGKILGATPAINLLKIDGSPIHRYRELIDKIDEFPRVTGSAPAVLRQVFIAGPASSQGIALKGVDPEMEPGVSDFFSRVISGTPHALDQKQAPFPEIGTAPLENVLIGKEMARNLGASTGDVVRIYNPMGRLTPLGMTVSQRQLRVAGIFDSGLYDINANWAYVHIETARRIFSLPPESALIIQLKIDNLHRTEEIAADIRARTGEGFITTTWIELNQPLFSALRLEKIILFITIGLIVFVASLNIVTTLIMMVLEKQGDIAILAAMGATGRTIQRVFMFQGLIIGLTGTAIGATLGVAVSWVLNHFRIIRLEAEIYSIPYVPFHVKGWDVALIACTAILISWLATIYPARNAAKVDPVKVLRYE
ncbi:MAG TPA: ABC transporter permease [Acidobacteriota bacterium]|nr:ABC transporter permease [Acidobacteriota bacterium]